MRESIESKFDAHSVIGRWVQPTLPGSSWVHWRESAGLKRLLSCEFCPLAFFGGYTLMADRDVRTLAEVAGGWSRGQRAEFAARFVVEAEAAKSRHLAVKLDEGAGDISELLTTYRDAVGLWWLAIGLDRAGVGAGGPPDAAASPHRRTWIQEILREQRDIAGVLKLRGLVPGVGQAADLPADLRDRLDRHVDAHSWYGTHHWHGSPYSTAKALAAISLLTQGDRRPVASPSAGETPPGDAPDLVCELSFWRLHFAEVTAKAVFDNRPALQGWAAGRGMNYGEFIHLSFEEVLALNADAQLRPPPKPVLHQRYQGYACELTAEGRERISSDPPTVAALVARAGGKAAAGVRGSADAVDLQGTVACGGPRVSGTYDLIADPTVVRPAETHADLLVAYETTPDFVPLLGGYRGVVTQMGGVTSHAAVVCRELGIPCIVGAEGVADVAEGGSRMEADFSTGAVRISR